MSEQAQQLRGERWRTVDTPGVGDTPPEDAPADGDLLVQLRTVNQRLRAEVAGREAAQDAARFNEERLKIALDLVDMGTWDWDISADRIVWSDNVEGFHGLEPGSFDGRYESWLELVHPEDRARVHGLVATALGDQMGHYDTEMRLCRADGQIRWIRVRGQVSFDESGSPARMLGTFVNISDQRRVEEELRRARDLAEEARATAEAASIAKNRFLSRMSHELRTPLNAVLGYAQLLELDAVGAQLDSVEHIYKAGRHLLDLIDEVLDIARIESGHLSMSPEPVLVSQALSEAVQLIRPLAEAAGISISPLRGPTLARYVCADRQRIKQVLLNLLSNAVKYNRPGGNIAVVCRPGSDIAETLSISVHDTGFGIPADEVDQLFTPFERLGAERHGIEGTGIGLALTKRLVEAMGGEVTVSSVMGHGSVFTVTLPLAEASPVMDEFEEDVLGAVTGEPEGLAVDEEGGDGPPVARWSVLSIEDNSSNARFLERLIALRPGWQLTSSEQGRLGLQLARSLTSSGSMDLVLLDLHLPDMHGVEVLRQLRSDPATADVPVVVLSADATKGAIRRTRQAGADGHLTKPFQITELLDILDAVAAGRALPAQDTPC